jgi:hypothetical protein
VRGGTIRHGGLGNGGGSLTLQIGDAIRTGLAAVGVGVVALEGVWVAVLAASRLGHVWHHLHTTRNGTGGSTAASSISRGCRAAESLSQLLHQGHGNIVGRNVDGIGDTKDDQGTLGREREAGIGSVETRTGGLLDLANTATTLADDGSNENVGD